MNRRELMDFVSRFLDVRQARWAARLWLKQYRSFRKAGRGRRWSAVMSTKITHSMLRVMNVVRP